MLRYNIYIDVYNNVDLTPIRDNGGKVHIRDNGIRYDLTPIRDKFYVLFIGTEHG